MSEKDNINNTVDTGAEDQEQYLLSTEGASDAAYAARMRFYIRWLSMTEEEQMEAIEKSVRGATKKQAAYLGTSGNPETRGFLKKESDLYGAEFDEYVNMVWVSILEQMEKEQDPDQIEKRAQYLEKSAQITQERVIKEIKSFLEKLYKKWETTLQNKNFTNAEFKQYLEKEIQKNLALLKEKEKYYLENGGYPELETLLRRPAQNKIASNRRIQEKQAKQTEQDGQEETESNMIEKTLGEVSFEDESVLRIAIEQFAEKLSEKEKEEIKLLLQDHSVKEIAEKIGITDKAIYKSRNKLKEKAKEEDILL